MLKLKPFHFMLILYSSIFLLISSIVLSLVTTPRVAWSRTGSINHLNIKGEIVLVDSIKYYTSEDIFLSNEDIACLNKLDINHVSLDGVHLKLK